jgi:hypothetical protein
MHEYEIERYTTRYDRSSQRNRRPEKEQVNRRECPPGGSILSDLGAEEEI